MDQREYGQMVRRVCSTEKESKDMREQRLYNEWVSKLPCADCALEDICRYANSIKRIDFNSEIFNITITCSRHITVDMEARKMEILQSEVDTFEQRNARIL